MKKCGNCGTEVPDNAANCPTCGGTITQTSAPAAPAPEPPKKKRTGCIVVVAIIVLLALVSAIGSCSNSCSKEAAKRSEDWPTSQLAQMIPSMNKKCESISETKDGLSITVSDKVSKNDFNSYVSQCKERGFDVDADSSTDSYTAYNKEGYRLSVEFRDFGDEKIDIDLSTPKVNSELVWPTMGLATKIPNPEKSKGSIGVDSSSQFTAYVGEMSKEDFNAYINKCVELGFNVDHSKTDDGFSVENAQGDSLNLEYQGFNTMHISLYAGKSTDSSSSASTNASTSTSSSSSAATTSQPTSGGSSDFKAVMDNYEKFFDEYIAFMQKYNESSDQISMMTDYIDFTSKYTTMMNELDSIDENTLSQEDLNYYLEVQNRINQKLINAAI